MRPLICRAVIVVLTSTLVISLHACAQDQSVAEPLYHPIGDEITPTLAKPGQYTEG